MQQGARSNGAQFDPNGKALFLSPPYALGNLKKEALKELGARGARGETAQDGVALHTARRFDCACVTSRRLSHTDADQGGSSSALRSGT